VFITVMFEDYGFGGRRDDRAATHRHRAVRSEGLPPLRVSRMRVGAIESAGTPSWHWRVPGGRRR